jgi:hypothetical protein
VRRSRSSPSPMSAARHRSRSRQQQSDDCVVRVASEHVPRCPPWLLEWSLSERRLFSPGTSFGSDDASRYNYRTELFATIA